MVSLHQNYSGFAIKNSSTHSLRKKTLLDDKRHQSSFEISLLFDMCHTAKLRIQTYFIHHVSVSM